MYLRRPCIGLSLALPRTFLVRASSRWVGESPWQCGGSLARGSLARGPCSQHQLCAMLFLIVLPFAFNSMHSNGKGMSSSAMPYKRTAPSWCKTTGTEVVDQVGRVTGISIFSPPMLLLSLAQSSRTTPSSADLQAGEEGKHPVPDRRCPARYQRYPPGLHHHRVQDPAYPEDQGVGLQAGLNGLH